MKKIMIAMSLNSLVLLAIIFIWPFLKPTRRGEIQIFNKSTELVEKSSVKVCGQTIEHSKIAVGAFEKSDFLVDCDGSFVVDVKLASGKTFSIERLGALKGTSCISQFEVTDAGIELISLRTR